jgi:hypothetical protein
MESTNSYKNGIPQFDGQKYAFWSIRMKTYIQAQGFQVWQSIVDGYTAPTVPPTVRKTGPWSNKIKQMRKQNTEDTQYKRDTDLRGSPSVGYVHQRNCQVLPLLLSSK